MTLLSYAVSCDDIACRFFPSTFLRRRRVLHFDRLFCSHSHGSLSLLSRAICERISLSKCDKCAHVFLLGNNQLRTCHFRNLDLIHDDGKYICRQGRQLSVDDRE